MILIKSIVSVVFSVLLLGGCATTNFSDEIAVGQVWTILDAPTDTTRLTIEKIEPHGDDIVVHVSIVGASPSVQKSPDKTIIVLGVFGQMPFEKSALLGSLDRLQQSGSTGSAIFEAGYQNWKDDNGGIFSIKVSDALEYSKALIETDSKGTE